MQVRKRIARQRPGAPAMLGSTAACGNGEHGSCTGCTEDSSMERRLAYMYSQVPAYVALPPCVCAVYCLYHLTKVSENGQTKYFG